MTESHKSRILLPPEAAAKVYTLKEYVWGTTARPTSPIPSCKGMRHTARRWKRSAAAVEALAGRLKEQLAGAEEAKRGESDSRKWQSDVTMQGSRSRRR